MPHRLPPDRRAVPTRSAHGFRWNAKHLAYRVAWSACRSFPVVVLRALEEASETFEIEFRLRRVSLGLDLQRQNKPYDGGSSLANTMPPSDAQPQQYTRCRPRLRW